MFARPTSLAQVYLGGFAAETPLVEIGMAPEHHQTTWCAEKAIEFLEGAPAYQMPWFFSVNIYDPHHSFDPPEEYLQRYAGMLGDIPLPNAREGEWV